MPLTESQKLAVESRGGTRLVSAAAGSGKTRVLVERLMRYVEDGADIDDFLVITYTRAAAGELRSRILSELGARVAADPANRRLRRQTELCCRAGIGTIDSLCGRFLRENAHLAALPPDFRVLEADRAAALRQTVLDRLLDRQYEALDRRPGLRQLIDTLGAGRDDRRLCELTVRLHEAVQSHPDPAAWLTDQKKALAVPPDADAGETAWGRSLLELYAGRAAYWVRRLEELYAALLAPGRDKLLAAYGDSLAGTLDGLREFVRAARQGWDSAGRAAAVPFPRFRPYRGGDALAESVKAARDACKKTCEGLQETFSALSAELLAEQELTRPALEALLDLTGELDRAYAAEKRRQGVVDFSDQEHMVLRLLEQRENGLAASLSGRYREVLVDEYQDVNECQDRLFTLLSDGGKKLFLVGDVKQSIYRFRLADPGIFLARYHTYHNVASARPDGEPGRILLRENFRSRPEVLDAVNHVFQNLMSPELGELAYDDDAALRPGREYPDGGGARARLTVLSLPEGADEERPDKVALEAAAVARQIRELVDARTPVTDGEGLRPAGYGDFAILLRSHKSAAARFRAALSAEGIPSVAQQGGGFFKSLEVTVLLSLLAVIDNPRQDVALLAVLRSPLYGFTPDELSAVRARDREADFCTALRAAAADMPRCRDFLAELEEYRTLAPDLSVEALLDRICGRAGLLALLAAMPDGEARRENVRVLLDYARQFEQDGYRGLFGFVSWMHRLEERGEEPRTGSAERADAVQLMSIHRSKGLEFPIVFLAGTGRRFNKADTRGAVLVHPELGVGARVTEPERGVEYPSLAWRAVAARLERETLSEELRVLYVAMTRARDRLYMTCLWSDPDKTLQQLREGLTSPVAPALLEGDDCPAKWLARAALLPGSPVELCLRQPLPPAEAPAAPEEEAPGAGNMTPEEETLRARLDWSYPRPWAAELPSKLTASALPGDPAPDPDGQTLPAPERRPRPARRPDFAGAGRPLSGVEKGVAVHTVLQFIDFARTDSAESVAGEIARLLAAGHLTEAQARAAEPERILALFRSALGRRLRSADQVWRELKFSLLTPAETWFPVPPGESVLLQGVVDCCLREGGALTVVDYKTDWVTPETLPGRAAEYAPQVRAYAGAVSRILGLPVRECVLYFLRTDSAVNVPIAAK